MLKNIVVSVLVIFTLLLSGRLYFLISNNPNEISNSTDDLVLKTINVPKDFISQDYVNQEHGYGIEFPLDWSYEEVLTGTIFRPEETADISNSWERAMFNYWDIRRFGANNLDFIIDSKKNMYDGFKITQKEIVLPSGLNGILFTVLDVENPDVVVHESLIVKTSETIYTINKEFKYKQDGFEKFYKSFRLID